VTSPGDKLTKHAKRMLLRAVERKRNRSPESVLCPSGQHIPRHTETQQQKAWSFHMTTVLLEKHTCIRPSAPATLGANTDRTCRGVWLASRASCSTPAACTRPTPAPADAAAAAAAALSSPELTSHLQADNQVSIWRCGGAVGHPLDPPPYISSHP